MSSVDSTTALFKIVLLDVVKNSLFGEPNTTGSLNLMAKLPCKVTITEFSVERLPIKIVDPVVATSSKFNIIHIAIL